MVVRISRIQCRQQQSHLPTIIPLILFHLIAVLIAGIVTPTHGADPPSSSFPSSSSSDPPASLDPHSIRASSPLSSPVAHSSHSPQSKFTQRDAMFIEDIIFGTDSSGLVRSQCPLDISLVWQAALNTGIYASSLITHLYSDRSPGKQVIVPGFHRELNILDHDGHHIAGSPINMASEVYFHSSPLLVDFNSDGIKDLLWINVDAEIYVLNGDPTSDTASLDYPWTIPKLKVKKRWYADLVPKHDKAAHAAAGGGRKLLGLEDYESPLEKMRREKSTTQRTSQHPATGRRLLQSRSRIAQQKQQHRLRKRGQNTETTKSTLQPPTPASTASAPIPVQGNTNRRVPDDSSASITPTTRENDRVQSQRDQQSDDENGDDENDDGTNDADDVNDNIEPPISPTDTANAHAALRAQYLASQGIDPLTNTFELTPEQEAQFIRDSGLVMPDAPGGNQRGDDQEGRAWNRQPQPAAEGENQVAAADNDGSDEADDMYGRRYDYNSPEIRRALDELNIEDSDLETLKRLSSLDQNTASDGDDEQQDDGDDPAADMNAYTAALQEIARKYARREADLKKRQAKEESWNTPEMSSSGSSSGRNSASSDSGSDSSTPTTEYENSINSNLVRILGDVRSDQPLPTAAPSEQALNEAFSQIADGLPEEARESLNLFAFDASTEEEQLNQLDPELAWELAELDRQYPVSEHDIWVDAHVLSTPVLVDLTGDGRPELIVTVSYFFDDTDYHSSPARLKRLGTDIDIKKYVAGGLVVIDPWKHTVLWQEHLDLTTDEVELKAYIYGSPTVVDLDGDGVYEIIVGTSLGLIYVFNSKTHALLKGFPIIMHEIQAQIAVGDVNGDGMLELIAMDSKGNVGCFAIDGTELWSTLISGFSSQPATFGDINGDGMMDVVIGTVSGHIWALNGLDGKVLPFFPLRTDGRIIAPITLVNLDEDPSAGSLMNQNLFRRGLHLVFPSFDGHVYIVDGRSGCTNKLDIGEHSYGQVLVADVLGRGKLDLLVTTMNGHVMLWSTESDAASSPLKTWASTQHGLNVFSSQHGYHGLFITPACKIALAEVHGSEFTIEYTIVDERRNKVVRLDSAGPTRFGGDNNTQPQQPPPLQQRGRIVSPKYEIEFRYFGKLIRRVSHTRPGWYSLTLPTSSLPQYTTIQAIMKNEHGQVYQDEVVSGMNVHWYKMIKYLVVIPFFVLVGMMLLVQKSIS